MRAVAEARANIALVKYWGKGDPALNLPAAGSLSLTVDRLVTRTAVAFGGDADRLVLDGVEQTGEALTRVARFLDLVRARAGLDERAHVGSDNDFPTASGLASSASAFAALALAASAAAGLSLSPAELSALARRGSGSAARSVFGGFAELRVEGTAAPLLAEDGWPSLRMVVAVVGGGARKPVGSRDGMAHTAATSPYYAAWLQAVPADLRAGRAAVLTRDLPALGEVAERSALAMHASALAARPGLVYLRGATVEAMHAVRELRRAGVGAWFTVDAGPHVKTLCAAADAPRVAAALAAVPGVTSTIVAAPGAGARLLEEPS